MGRRVLDKTRGRDDLMDHIFRLLQLNDFLIWIKFFVLTYSLFGEVINYKLKNQNLHYYVI